MTVSVGPSQNEKGRNWPKEVVDKPTVRENTQNLPFLLDKVGEKLLEKRHEAGSNEAIGELLLDLCKFK